MEIFIEDLLLIVEVDIIEFLIGGRIDLFVEGFI